MTIIEAMTLSEQIQSGKFDSLKGSKFVYALARSKEILAKELKLIKDTFPTDPRVEAFQQEREKSILSFCKKDEKNAPIIENNMYTFAEGEKEKFEEEVKTLIEKNKDILNEYDLKIKEFNLFCETEIPFELHKVKSEDLPTEISLEQMNALLKLVKE